MRKLYRSGDTTVIWGVSCDYMDFPDEQVEARLKEGWSANPLDFGTYFQEDKPELKLTRPELKILAKEYKVKIAGKSDDEIYEEILNAKNNAGK